MNKRSIKRFLVGAAGAIVLAAGLAMIVLPGPAIVFIPLGLAILAVEFAWAKRWLEKVETDRFESETDFGEEKERLLRAALLLNSEFWILNSGRASQFWSLAVPQPMRAQSG